MARRPPRDDVRIASLDGLRGLAVLLVLVHHFGVLRGATGAVSASWNAVASWGWTGVELFFVLSGFLITGILLDTRPERHYFRNFYARRTLRIFPLYYATVAALLLCGAAHHAPWLWSYSLNYLQAAAGDFHVAGAVTGHFWSLCVEEQFYLVWPLVVWVTPARHLRAVCIAVLGMSIAVRGSLLLGGMPAPGPHVILPGRLDGLVIGAWLASAARDGVDLRATDRRAVLAALAGLVAVFLALPYRNGLMHSMSVTPVALLAASMLYAALEDPRRFTSPVLVTAGRYSYGLYVFHVPVKVGLAAVGLDAAALVPVVRSGIAASVTMIAIGTALSFGVAYLSWHLFEKRILSLKRYFPRASAPRNPHSSSELVPCVPVGSSPAA